MEKNLSDALAYIQKLYDQSPEIGIILGTGLGGLATEIDVEKEIPYNFIPHFPLATAESHFGKLIFGTLGGKKVVAMQGRVHFYEGYSMQALTFPIRVLKLLGIHTLLISNASGGLNLEFDNGDLMIVDDHINLQTANPLIGPNLNDLGPRFPDMSRPYDPGLIQKVESIGAELGHKLHKGVYVAVTGPNLETRAEYRFLRLIGADVVGMSTVPEVLVARHMNLKVCTISVITDMCDPDNLHEVSLDDVIAVANAAEPKLTAIFARLIEEM